MSAISVSRRSFNLILGDEEVFAALITGSGKIFEAALVLQLVLQACCSDGFPAHLTNLLVQILDFLLQTELEVFGPTIQLLNL